MNRVLKRIVVVCAAVGLSSIALAQTAAAPAQRPCVAFASENSSTAHFSQNALQSAITQGGDLDFFPTQHGGCWTVHEISATLGTTPQGYAISWVVTDLHDLYVAHGLNVGQQEEFTKAMQSAADAARKDINTQRSH